MKIAFIVVSIAVMAGAVAWLNGQHNATHGRLSLRQKLNILVTSLVIGIAVYFGLLLLALAWMALR